MNNYMRMVRISQKRAIDQILFVSECSWERKKGMEVCVIKIKSDAEELYQEYLKYQSGDKSALERVFFVEESNRFQELTNKYYSSLSGTEYMDNVLDSEFIKSEIADEQKKHNSKVKFRFACLNRILSNAKRAYSKNYTDTGYNNGIREKGGYRKFHEGEYDTFDIQEIMIEIVIKIFQGKLISRHPITNADTLLGNIKYHLEKEIGKVNDVLYKNISESKKSIDCEGEETYYSYFDEFSEKSWIDSQRDIDRLLVYSDSLKWIIKNDIHKLFKEDSDDIHAIIEGILRYKHMFKSKNQEGLTKDPYKKLQEYILRTTGRNILSNNISMDLGIIEQNLLNHLMYALNYEIVRAPKNSKLSKNESRRLLKGLDPKRYLKLFGRQTMNIFEYCTDYINLNNCYSYENFLATIREYNDMVIPILEREKGKRKYDMVNLLTCDIDMVEGEIGIVSNNIAETLIAHYQRIEKDYICNFLDQYNILDRFTDGKSKYWQANYSDKKKRLNLKFFSDADIKCPVSVKFKKKELLVYEGYKNYYFCNTESKCCYCVPKDNRVIVKSDKNHKILWSESA